MVGVAPCSKRSTTTSQGGLQCKMRACLRTCTYYPHRHPSSPCTDLRPPHPEPCLVPRLNRPLLSLFFKPARPKSMLLSPPAGLIFLRRPYVSASSRPSGWLASGFLFHFFFIRGGYAGGIEVGKPHSEFAPQKKCEKKAKTEPKIIFFF